MTNKVSRDKLNELLSLHKSQKTQQSLGIPAVVAEHMTKESLEVLEAFGMDVPHLLNQYCCSVEDALIDSVNRATKLQERLLVLSDENQQLKELKSGSSN